MAQEVKSISVNPNYEQEQINLWQDFGWEFKSSQEIYNKDSHEELRGDDVYSVTETTHYVKLVFTRDTTINNYEKIVALENEYNSLKFKNEDFGPHFNWIWLISFFVYGIGLILFIILKLVNNKKKKEAQEYNYQIAEKLEDLHQQAKKLLN